MGHPEPFNLKYLAVGNEQWDYDEKHGGYGQQAKVLLGEYARQDKQLEHLQRRGGKCPHCVPFYSGYRLAA